MRLKDKVAIITGAGQSQGRCATLLFCKEGAKVVAADWHKEQVEETVALARERGGEAIACHMDARKEDQVQDMVRLAADTYGKLNVLYNNHAVDLYSGPCTGVDEKSFDLVINVNLKGYFFSCKHAIPEMIKSGGGSIINIASVQWFLPTLAGGSDPYAMTKAGVVTLTRSIAGSFGDKNIRCNVISPGIILSVGHQKILENPEMLEGFRAAVGPMNRIGRPEDIVYCAIYLASNESSHTTGAHIVIDGGLSLTRGATFSGDVASLLKDIDQILKFEYLR